MSNLPPTAASLYSLLDSAWVEADKNDAPALAWVYINGKADHAGLRALLARPRIAREISTRRDYYGLQAAFNTPH